MKDFSNNIISAKSSVIEAMTQLNSIPDSLTLFVVDEKQCIRGTLTDGDIRRGFIAGLTTNDPLDKFMQKTFYKVSKGFSLNDFKQARSRHIRLLPVVNEDGIIEKVIDMKKCRSILPLEAVIMAGGRGERLMPLTGKTPKPMLMLGNKPIIEHNIDRLISYGIEKIYISIKYLGQQISDYFGDGSAKGVKIEYIHEDMPLGTAGALGLINTFESDYFLLMNSDLFTDADFEDLYVNTLKTNAVAGVASVPYTTNVPLGIFSTDNDVVTGLKEKPLFTHYANAGIYIFSTQILSKIPKSTFFNATDLLSQLIDEGLKVIHNPIVGYWIDIGQHQDYKNAQEIAKHLHHDHF
ncbi:MAG: nucleotidyltransferase family protein [Bacteroidales bacterium]|jgi:dTDP-glucose pyrophosphorylase|nr:nucleotidyltransferase family protein [Bacteroidales bacterium]